MKKLIFLLSLVVIAACADKNNNTTKKENLESEVEAKAIAKEENKELIPSYNFEEFTQFLTKENDTTYVINFWATWCKPCIKELPAFEKLNAVYSDKKVKVLLVSLDFPNKIEKQVIPFIADNNIESEVVLLDDDDSNTWIPKVSENWSGAIPATIIYKNESKKFYERSFTFEELENELKLIL